MKILYACTLYPPAIGGAQIHLHCLASRMQARNHDVRVLCQASRNRQDWLRLATVAPEPRREYQLDGVAVTQLGFSTWTRMRMFPWATSYYPLMEPAVRRISRLLGDQIPWPIDDVSLVHASRVGREFLARAALDFARKRQIPFVLTPNHHPRWDGYLYREYDKIYREADAVIALTDAEKELLIRQKRVRADRIHVTGIGPMLSDQYSAEKFRDSYGIHDRFVLFLGQQLQYKGIGALVAAAPRVWRSHPNVRFVFIGPPSDYSAKLFSRMNDHRLINLGGVDIETKTSALAACEFLCPVPAVHAGELRRCVCRGLVVGQACDRRPHSSDCRCDR
jgi:glycosyltransferase involved in cell wall biosynthesis